MSTQKRVVEKGTETSKVAVVALIRFAILGFLVGAALFLSAGRFDWWEGWTYLALFMGTLVFFRFYLIIRDPDRIAERMEAPRQETTKSWDRPFVLLLSLLWPLAAWIVAGLDVRFGWSPDLPLWVQWLGFALMLLGTLFFNWAMLTNRFFSSHVRIQTDRDHEVVSSGPYRIVRHPGYAGDALSWIAVPFFFSSFAVGFISVLVIVTYAVRIVFEDRTLQEELPGYRDYAKKVRYRLIPGIW